MQGAFYKGNPLEERARWQAHDEYGGIRRMGGRGDGVRSRGGSIQIDFRWKGQRCRETLKLEPTKANLLYASRLRSTILNAIATGTFRYSDYFPESPRAAGEKGRRIKVADALASWLDSIKKTIAHSTWIGYESAVRIHLIPSFGEKLLHSLTTSDIRSWIGMLDVSAKSINNDLIPLRAIFADAYQDGLIDKNPMERIGNLKVQTREANPFTMEEMGRIIDSASGQMKNLIRFAFWTGLRTSELIGLEWGDVDWKKALVRVERAFVAGAIKETKTKGSKRPVLLFPEALKALTEQKEHTFLEGGRIFRHPYSGEPWRHPNQIGKLWQPILKRAGVPFRNPYQTRHTYASMLLSAGENPMFVAAQMGHASWIMLARVYGKWIPENATGSGDRIGLVWSQYGHKEKRNESEVIDR